MNFARGGEILQHLDVVKRFPEEQARFYIVQVALALAHLHSKHIIHRDLKPQNILMTDEGYLVLTDFGLSKLLDGMEVTQSFCGTPEFLAPEVINGYKYAYEVDWWSLGILAFNLLVGATPFHNAHNDQSQMFMAIKKNDIKFPKFNEQRKKIILSDECKDFVQRLLDKEPSTRLGTKGGVEEIFAHPWMNIDIDSIRNKTMEAPMKPDLEEVRTRPSDKEVMISMIP